MSPITKSAAAVAALSLMSRIVAVGWAAEAPASDSSTLSIPTVEVTGSSYRPLDEAPAGLTRPSPAQTVTSIDRSRFDAQPAFTIGDVLQQSPGVTFITGNGPRDISISIRGSNERQTFAVRNIQLFEDGFPVTQPDGTGRTDLADPHAYSRIDVVRGPSSAQYGNYATGGAIDFVTGPGRDIQGAEFGTDAGSFGYLNNYGTLGWAGKGYQASIFASNVRGDGFIGNSRFDTATVNALASYNVTDRDRVTIKIIQNSLDTALPIRLSLNQFNRNPFQKNCAGAATPGCATVTLFNNDLNGATQALTASQAGLGRFDSRTIVGTRWEHAFDDRTILRTQVTFDNRNIKQPTNSTDAIGPYTSINVMSSLTNRSRILGLDATSSVGVNFNDERLNSYTYNLTPLGGATRDGLTQTVFGRVINAGARAREEMAITPAVTGVLALGGEYTELVAAEQNFGYPSAGGRTTTTIPVARTFGNIAPEAALLYAPAPEWTLHTRVATGYGTPQPTNLFVLPSGLFGNNVQLQTQTNVGVDVGTTYALADRIQLDVTGFYEFFHNELVTQSAGANLPSYTFNAPRSEHRGIEIGVTAKPLPQRLPGLTFFASYLYDNQLYTQYSEQLSSRTATATFDRSGKRIPGVTPNFLFARLGYDQSDGPLHGLGAFVETNFRDAFYVDNGNLLKAPSYAIVNLEAHYDPGIKLAGVSKLRVFFEVQNLFNKTYVASANNITDTLGTGGLQNGASTLAAATGSIYAGSPRAFFGGVRIAL